jgi:hypothetical protein
MSPRKAKTATVEQTGRPVEEPAAPAALAAPADGQVSTPPKRTYKKRAKKEEESESFKLPEDLAKDLAAAPLVAFQEVAERFGKRVSYRQTFRDLQVQLAGKWIESVGLEIPLKWWTVLLGYGLVCAEGYLSAKTDPGLLLESMRRTAEEQQLKQFLGMMAAGRLRVDQTGTIFDVASGQATGRMVDGRPIFGPVAVPKPPAPTEAAAATEA